MIPAPISEQTALLSGLLFTTIYIAPFYLSPTLRSTSLSSRDSPTVIAARVKAVFLSCLISTLITISILTIPGHASIRDVLRLFGLAPVLPWDCGKVLLLLAVLFLGPLYEYVVVDAAWKEWRELRRSVKDTFWTTWPAFRNMVVAPWCEELVFRSLVISLYLLANVAPARIVFVSPLIFGAAHVHHLVDYVRTHTPQKSNFPPVSVLATGLLISAIQFTYTSLFGFFAAFVYLRTGNMFASVTAHTFCNFMGLPRVYGRVGVGAWPGQGEAAKGDASDKTGFHDAPVTWTAAYYILLVAGAVGFYALLWPLTLSTNALVRF
jgi:prenyl protein peptidase